MITIVKRIVRVVLSWILLWHPEVPKHSVFLVG